MNSILQQSNAQQSKSLQDQTNWRFYLYNRFFNFAQIVILVNIFYFAIHIITTTIYVYQNWNFLDISDYLIGFLMATIFILVGLWFVNNLKNAYVAWGIIFIFILFTFFRLTRTPEIAQVKYLFRTIYPILGILDTSPSFNYFMQNIIEDGQIISERLSFIQSYPIATTWGFISVGLTLIVLVIVFLIHFITLFRVFVNRIIVYKENKNLKKEEKKKGKDIKRKTKIKHWDKFIPKNYSKKTLKSLFTKRNLIIYLIPWLILSSLVYANMNGYERTITIDVKDINANSYVGAKSNDGEIRISSYGIPNELRMDVINKTWIENTTDGQLFVSQLARYNFTAYIHLNKNDLENETKANEIADYIDYLYKLGIHISVDGWCNIKYYYDNWLPMFKAVVNFRTNPLYIDRLKGMTGISGDFEPNHASGYNKTLYNEIYENVSAELLWMRNKLAAANLTRNDFKFGSIGGVYLDYEDGDTDIQEIAENWFILDYDFDAPMFYTDGVWMYGLYRNFQLYSWEHAKYLPNIEKRVLLGITGRGHYQSDFGLDYIVKEINIARSFGVVDVGFYFGRSPFGLFDCFEGTHVMINGTDFEITKYNILDILMNLVYENKEFSIKIKHFPDFLPNDQLGNADWNLATGYMDTANLDVNNLIAPLGFAYKDLYYNADHNQIWYWIEYFITILSTIAIMKYSKKNV